MLSRAGVGLALAGLTALVSAGCSPGAPEGVEKATLDAEVSDAIGDPTSCVLIAEKDTGDVVYRYNTNTVCARSLPSCQGETAWTVGELLELTRQDGQVRMLSCYTAADRSRSVGWASGPVAARPSLAYAAVMEGDRAFPGRMIADRLANAFEDAGL